MNVIQTFKKARKLLEQDAISLTYHGEDKFVFEVLGLNDKYTVSLTFNKIGGGLGIYQKVWSCTCKSSSIRGMLHNVECAHTIACLSWIIRNISDIK